MRDYPAVCVRVCVWVFARECVCECVFDQPPQLRGSIWLRPSAIFVWTWSLSNTSSLKVAYIIYTISVCVTGRDSAVCDESWSDELDVWPSERESERLLCPWCMIHKWLRVTKLLKSQIGNTGGGGKPCAQFNLFSNDTNNYSSKSFRFWCNKLCTPRFGGFVLPFTADPLNLCPVGWGPSVHRLSLQTSGLDSGWVTRVPELFCVVLAIIVLLEGEPSA